MKFEFPKELGNNRDTQDTPVVRFCWEVQKFEASNNLIFNSFESKEQNKPHFFQVLERRQSWQFLF